MKKGLMLIALLSVIAMGLCACGNVKVNVKTGDTKDTPSENMVGMANPWRDCTEEEAYQYGPNGFSAPEGATDVKWSLMLPDNDPAKEVETLVQMRFTLDGTEYNAREQMVGDNADTDISGVYCEWQSPEDVTLANWAGGNMKGVIRRCSNGDDSASLCTWYDVETGYAYSLSVFGQGMDKVDIKAVAESIYDPAKQIGANMPD